MKVYREQRPDFFMDVRLDLLLARNSQATPVLPCVYLKVSGFQEHGSRQ